MPNMMSLWVYPAGKSPANDAVEISMPSSASVSALVQEGLKQLAGSFPGLGAGDVEALIDGEPMAPRKELSSAFQSGDDVQLARKPGRGAKDSALDAPTSDPRGLGPLRLPSRSMSPARRRERRRSRSRERRPRRPSTPRRRRSRSRGRRHSRSPQRRPMHYKTTRVSPSRMDGSFDGQRAQRMCEDREAARACRDFQRADRLRDDLERMGVLLNDRTCKWQGPDGTGGCYRKAGDGDWVCPECDDNNFERRAMCRSCGAPKPRVESRGRSARSWSRRRRGRSRSRS
eukprot:TRINITY_DN32653_c0_g1_i1.p1 TRINITY_DN32653_c0_g1~~TRINITY_DN32653_c0_g1_i1.p1  ORF type:complete len:319 (+),score=86.18 TRINITY_DN32653_c0_g1_i1:99-959(+)